MMGLVVADLMAKLGLDSSEFDRGMDGVAAKATRSEKILGGVSKAAMAGAVAAGALVVKSLDTYNNFGTAINTLTRLTGMSSQAASKLTGQWQRFGVESASGINATKFLAKNLDAAQQGGKPLIETFKRLGVSLKEPDGKLRSIGDVLPEVRNKLAEMDNAGQRTAMTLKLFGRGGADMLGWLTKTPGEIAKVNKELAGLGMVWGGKQVKDWQALKDMQRDMGLQWTALQLDLTQTLLPAMKTLMGYVREGIKDWNNLSSGAKGFILTATGVVGVLGMIAPKALAAGAAIKTMFAASAVGGAASAAGSAGGGLASGVAANVASAAGIGGASKGYQSLTASKMMGGVGVTPAAYLAGTASVAGSVVKMAGIVGAFVIAAEVLGKLYGDRALKPGEVAPPGEAGGEGIYKSHGVKPDTRAADAAAKAAAAAAAKAAAAIDNVMSKLGAKATTATGPAFDRIREEMTRIKTLMDKGFKFGDINAKHTDSQMRSIRDRIMSTLHITQKQADAIMASMFKSWHPLPTVMGKVSPAMAAAEARINQLRANAARQIQFGNPNVTGLINSIAQASAAFYGMSSAARTAGNAAANALAAASGAGPSSYRGHFMAAGGIVTRPQLTMLGENFRPEAVIPLTNPRRAAQVMDEAGLTGRGGGPSFTFGSVSVVLPPGDYGDSEDAGSAAADAFMQRTREIARGY